jgi:hypothetical protein
MGLLIAYLTIFVLIFSIVYYISVVASEICGCTPKFVQKLFAKKQKHHRKYGATNLGSSDSDDDDPILSVIRNPQFLTSKNDNNEKNVSVEVELSSLENNGQHVPLTNIKNPMKKGRGRKHPKRVKKIDFGERKIEMKFTQPDSDVGQVEVTNILANLDKKPEEEVHSSNGRRYSYNYKTGVSKWLDEDEDVKKKIIVKEKNVNVDDDIVIHKHGGSNGRRYSYNKKTGVSKWLD